MNKQIFYWIQRVCSRLRAGRVINISFLTSKKLQTLTNHLTKDRMTFLPSLSLMLIHFLSRLSFHTKCLRSDETEDAVLHLFYLTELPRSKPLGRTNQSRAVSWFTSNCIPHLHKRRRAGELQGSSADKRRLIRAPQCAACDQPVRFSVSSDYLNVCAVSQQVDAMRRPSGIH